MRVTINAYTMPKSIVNPDYIVSSIRYVVSSDPTFTTTHLKDIVKTPSDNNMMKYSFEYDFPNEEILYSFTETTFVNNEVEKSTTCRLSYLQPGFSFNNNIINTPVISIKNGMDGDIVPADNIVLVLSEFSMFLGHGNLDSTTWKIYDSENRLVLNKIKDEFNETSLMIPNGLLEDNRMYRIEAVYYNNYDSESYPAVMIINTAGGFNSFSIEADTVNFVNNGISTFSTRCDFINFKHLEIDIMDSAGDVIIKNFISSSRDVTIYSKDVTISRLGLVAGERYYITVSAVFLNNRGELTRSKALEFSTVCKDVGKGKEYDPIYKYNNSISTVIYNLNNTFIEKIGGTTEQLDNGDIPIFKISSSSIEIKYFKYLNNTLVDTNRGFISNTTNTIDITTAVNIKVLKDLVSGLSRMIIAYNLTGNKIELKSYVYNSGSYGNIDAAIPASTIIINDAKVLDNSDPIIDFKDDEFTLALISLIDKKNIIVFKKDLSSHSYLTNLYQDDSVVGNSTSTFRLPDNNMLKITSDIAVQRFGKYNVTNNNYVNMGALPPVMQNVTGNSNTNKWFGFDRADGSTLLIPRFNSISKFNVFLYNYYENKMETVIPRSDIIVPGKYENAGVSTITNIYSIVLKDGNLLLIMSGSKAGTDFKDVWKYI